MSFEVKLSINMGVIQYATCDSCDWSINTSIGNDTPYECRKHIRDNPSHIVTQSYSNEFIYSSKEE